VEVTRQVLAENPQFEPYSAFKRLDFDNNGFLSPLELLAFLEDNNIRITETENRSFFQTFDSDRDGRISYTEFLAIVLPQEHEALKRRVLNREAYPRMARPRLSYDVEYSLARLFEEELRFYRSAAEDRHQLVNSIDFSALNCFKVLDDNSQGFLDFESVDGFLKDLGMPIAESEVDGLFRRLDTDKDRRISYSEFVDAVTPSSGERLSSSLLRSSLGFSGSRASSPRRPQSRSGRRSTSNELTSSVQRQDLLTSMRKSLALEREYTEFLESKARRERSVSRSRSPARERLSHSEVLSPSRVNQTPKKGSSNIVASAFKTPTRSNRFNQSGALELSAKSRSRERAQARGSPLREADELQLVSVLKEAIDNDKEIERAKSDLALRSDFSLIDAFRLFDVQEKGYLTTRDMESGLRRLGVYATYEESYLFMRRYDFGRTGFLKFSDFCEALTPKTPEFARLMNTRAASDDLLDQNLVRHLPCKFMVSFSNLGI
jgi:Ca2+-binding EF-hand superfamily protein